MKKSIYIIACLVCISALFYTGCSSDDKIIEQVTDGTTRGAVLRTLEVKSSFFNRDNVNSEWEIVVEEQDIQNGKLLSEVNVYAKFTDNTTPNGANTKAEQLIKTINADAFETNKNNLPQASISVRLSEVLSALGLKPKEYDGDDVFTIRLELVLTDGRIISASDVSGQVASGSFFKSPFQYVVPLICIPPKPFTGTYQMDLSDSYGDGWNGASVQVVLDGNATTYTIDSGSAKTVTFNVPNGSNSLEFFWKSGSFDSEIGMEIKAPSGNVVYDGVPSNSGQFYLNLCDE